MKSKIITILFICYILIFSICHLILKDQEISTNERRKLAKFPEFKFDSEYITKVDKYLLDHFPLRNHFRSIKANYNYKLLRKLDNNGIYLNNGNIYKSNYPTNYKSIDSFINHINKISELLTDNNKIYMMIIPDKNYYLESSDFLHLDYDYIYDKLDNIEAANIDVRNVLNLEDYYKTDTHWKQENLDKVIKKMSEVMDFNYQKINYKENTYNNFYGVYYGEAAIKADSDVLTYLTSDVFNNLEVNYLENKDLNSLYNLNKLNSLDPYEVYLDGASAFIEITNNNSTTDSELIIFRDSFASSITPLLINYYSKITLIDNRYIDSTMFKELIDFNNQDVLFMYSTLIVNNTSTLKDK